MADGATRRDAREMSKVIRLVLVVGSLAALAASATSYGPKGFVGGYSDTQLADGVYMIDVEVNGYTSRGTALEFLYRRAYDLCPTGFDVMDRESGQDTTYWRTSQTTVQAIEKPNVSAVIKCKLSPQPAQYSGPPGAGY
jgi:hypothetical protein